MPAVLGLALLFSWGAYHILEARATMGAVLAIVLGGWFLLIGGIEPAAKLRQDRARQHATYDFFRVEASRDVPLIIATPHAFFQLSYYAPPELAHRFVYLADPAASLRYVGTDTVDLGLAEFRRWTPLRVEDYRVYLQTYPRFMLYGDRRGWAWLLPALVAKGARIQVLALDGTNPLYLVDTVTESDISS
jgi:hypothetical protein